MKQQRLVELDAIRGIAALAVVIFHYFFRYNEIYGHPALITNWAYFGHYGVQLFFMVSGFVIFWTLTRVKQPLDFIVSRFSRLYPTYWSAVLVTFAIVSIFGLPGREVSVKEALMNVLMFQSYLGIKNVDGVYWTLIVELSFYFWIFLFYLTSSLSKVTISFTLLTIASALHSLGMIQIPQAIYVLLILYHLPFFLAGIAFYQLINNTASWQVSLTALTVSLLSTVAIYSFDKFLIFAGFYLLFYLAVSGQLKLLTNKPFIFLGSISYSLYLLHQNIGYVIINKSYEQGLNPIVGILIAVVFSTTLATLFVKYVERPSLNYIRSAYKKNNINRRGIDK